ncbi:hypothetical protein ACJZ2D_006626 [Fusarium nematophilum]
MTVGYPAKVVQVITRGDIDDNSTITIRYHGRSFDIYISPDAFSNSPNATALYLKYLKAIHPIGPGEFDDVCDEDVYEWIIGIFQPLFNELAPTPLPSFDPEKIRAKEAKPLLSEYLFPQRFGCKLEAKDEKFIPRHVDDRGLEVSFKDPMDSLDQIPARVIVSDKSGNETTCFFKDFLPGIPDGSLSRELATYQRIHKANIGPDVHLGRLMGVVHEQKTDAILGLLLRYVDGLTLEDALYKKVSPETKEKWEKQIREAVAELHKIGTVWGDAKALNVLIDKENNAWLTEFEGGYTQGWVDEDKAGTVEGDLQGLDNIVKRIWEEREMYDSE